MVVGFCPIGIDTSPDNGRGVWEEDWNVSKVTPRLVVGY